MKKETQDALIRAAGIYSILKQDGDISDELGEQVAGIFQEHAAEFETLLRLLVAAGFIDVCLRDSSGSYISFEPETVWLDGCFHFDCKTSDYSGMSLGKKGERKYFDVSEIEKHIDAAKGESS